MNPLMWLVSLVRILSTAVVFGRDMFFLTISRPAPRLASPSAGTRNHEFFHMFVDARMPIWGVLAILSNFLHGRVKQEWAALVLFRIALHADSIRHYRLQTEAAKTGERLNNGREPQASWNLVLYRTAG